VEKFVPEDSEFAFEVVSEDFVRFGPGESSMQIIHFGNGFVAIRRAGDAVGAVWWCRSVEAFVYVKGLVPGPRADFSKREFVFPPAGVLGFDEHLSMLAAHHRFRTVFQGSLFPRAGSYSWSCGPVVWSDPQGSEQRVIVAVSFGFRPGNLYLVGFPGFRPDFCDLSPYEGPAELPAAVIDPNDPVVVIGRIFDAAGLWGRKDRVRLGGGKKDFVDPSREGAQYWFVDAENLAEGEVEVMLLEMRKSLKKCGVKLQVRTIMSPDEEDSTGYRVSINGVETEIFSYRFGSDVEMDVDDPWMEATLRPLAVVNRLLEQAGTVYRLSVFEPGGVDTMVLLAPQDVLSLLPNHPELADYTFIQP
jgi:hypothetical protein